MPKYRATFLVDATIVVEVEADTKEEAEQLAWDKAHAPCLCHQCSDDLEVGDITDLHDVEEVS